MENAIRDSVSNADKEKLEKYFKSAKLGLMFLIGLPIVIIICGVLYLLGIKIALEIGLISGVLITATAIIWYAIAYNCLIKLYKSTIVAKTLEMTFDSCTFNPKEHIAESAIIGSRLFTRNEVDKVRGADYVAGTYKGVSFAQSYLRISKIETRVDSEGHVHKDEDVIFNGRWMIFDFNKPFVTDMSVCEGFDCGDTQGMVRVKLDSVQFNKKFRVFAESEHDCYYILTPHFMEKLMQIEENNKGKFLMSFQDGKLSIALHNNKKSYTVSLKGKFDINALCESAMLDTKLVTDMVDVLKLNEKIFKQ